jgi:ferritin-like metal-binding protein YciE
MFERLNTPQELYNFKLGSALKSEQKVLDMLEKNLEEAHDPAIKQLLQHHHEETRQQIGNLEQAFSAMGWEPDESPCPTMEALEKQAKAEIKMTDDALVDNVVLAGAAETEHHEIAMYETLITHAQAMGRDDVVGLLQQNLEQEMHTLDEVRSATQRLATVTAGRAA